MSGAATVSAIVGRRGDDSRCEQDLTWLIGAVAWIAAGILTAGDVAQDRGGSDDYRLDIARAFP